MKIIKYLAFALCVVCLASCNSKKDSDDDSEGGSGRGSGSSYVQKNKYDGDSISKLINKYNFNDVSSISKADAFEIAELLISYNNDTRDFFKANKEISDTAKFNKDSRLFMENHPFAEEIDALYDKIVAVKTVPEDIKKRVEDSRNQAREASLAVRFVGNAVPAAGGVKHGYDDAIAGQLSEKYSNQYYASKNGNEADGRKVAELMLAALEDNIDAFEYLTDNINELDAVELVFMQTHRNVDALREAYRYLDEAGYVPYELQKQVDNANDYLGEVIERFVDLINASEVEEVEIADWSEEGTVSVVDWDEEEDDYNEDDDYDYDYDY